MDHTTREYVKKHEEMHGRLNPWEISQLMVIYAGLEGDKNMLANQLVKQARRALGFNFVTRSSDKSSPGESSWRKDLSKDKVATSSPRSVSMDRGDRATMVLSPSNTRQQQGAETVGRLAIMVGEQPSLADIRLDARRG